MKRLSLLILGIFIVGASVSFVKAEEASTGSVTNQTTSIEEGVMTGQDIRVDNPIKTVQESIETSLQTIADQLQTSGAVEVSNNTTSDPARSTFYICKMIVDLDAGTVTDGTDLLAKFSIRIGMSATQSKLLNTHTPLRLNTDVDGDGVDDMQCWKFDNVPVGTYHYSDEKIDSAGPIFNQPVYVEFDRDIAKKHLPFTSVKDFVQTARQHADTDHQFILSADQPHGLVVINSVGRRNPTITTKLGVCKLLVDSNKQITDGTGIDATFSITIGHNGQEKTISTHTPLNLEYDIVGNEKPDIVCTQREVEPGVYTYSDEMIDSETDFARPFYFDLSFNRLRNLPEINSYEELVNYFHDHNDTDHEVALEEGDHRVLLVVNRILDGGGTGQNNPPVAIDDSYTANTSETITFNVMSNDYDPDGDDIDITSISAPTGGEITDYNAETGEVTYKAPGTQGSYEFSYTITDGDMTDTATVNIDVSEDGGGSGGSGGSGGGGGTLPPVHTGSNDDEGEVLGESTTGEDQEDQIEACGVQYLTMFIHPADATNSVEVKKLQIFLNMFEGANLALTGVYDAATIAAVNAYQLKYADEILAPWGITEPTGYVYLTTRKHMNERFCRDYSEPLPPILIPDPNVYNGVMF